MIRQFSAGGCVFKKENNQVLWLIIKPRPSEKFPKERYQLPKGLIDKDESTEQAAIREVKEETGITGKIAAKVDNEKLFYKLDGEQIFKIVTYFLMEYESGEPITNEEVEEIYWLPFEDAKKKLTYSNDKSVLQKAQDLLSQYQN